MITPNSRAMRRSRALVLLIALSMLTQACTSLHAVTLPTENLGEQVARNEVVTVGERLRITTRDGKTHDLRVTRVSEASIEGKHEIVAVGEIQALSLRRFSATKTTLLIVTGAAVVGLIAVAVAQAGAWGNMGAVAL